jgi:sulfate adenylyltransferase subunit 1
VLQDQLANVSKSGVADLAQLTDADKPETQGQATLAFTNIRAALEDFALAAGIEIAAVVPISALIGHNVVDAADGWCGYHGPSLLKILELLPSTPADTSLPLAFPVQWVEKFSSSADTAQGRRVFWGRVATGQAQVGQTVKVLPSGQTATVAQVLGHIHPHECPIV